jgi:uncharacterized protein (TIGR03643 family)
MSASSACQYFHEQLPAETCYIFMKTQTPELTDQEIDRIIEMAWEDRTPFDAILAQFGLKEQEVIDLMRREMKPSSWRMWRERVQGRATKHKAKSAVDDARFKSTLQKNISLNKISKR